MRPGFSQSTSLRVLLAGLAAKLVWDIVLIAQAWPDHSRPKLGIAIVLPVLIVGLLKDKHWALNLTGVVSIFWITFIVAQMLMQFLTVGSEDIPTFPWSNLIALPALVFVLNHLKTDEELKTEAESR